MAGNDDGANLGTGTALKETGKALLIELDEHGEEKWIPKSVIHADSEVFSLNADENVGEVVVMYWWAEKEQLI